MNDMSWLTAIVVAVALYYILPMIFDHRERMARLKSERKDQP
jgi:uncharacterized membrane protein SirB2